MDNEELINKAKQKTDELVRKTPVEGTPFEIVTINEENSFVGMGRFKLTEYFANEEEAQKAIVKKDWNLIMATIGATVQTLIEENNKATEKYLEMNYNKKRKKS